MLNARVSRQSRGCDGMGETGTLFNERPSPKEHIMRFPLRRLFGVLALILVSLAAALPPPALAATECTGSPISGVTIQGNLTVPNGGYCVLVGSTVTGNVTVSANARILTSGATIQGNLRGDGVAGVVLTGDTVVKGKVTVSGASGSVDIEGSQVNGNVTITGNATTGALAVKSSTIGGNLTVSGNSSHNIWPVVINNTIGGNLSCDGNLPSVYVSGNVVSGTTTGQCAAL
jgi:hypothetical protein